MNISILDLLPIEVFSNDIGKPEHDEYIKSGNYYEHYYELSKLYKPETILEIGVRYGYSLLSMIAGSKDTISYVEGWDNDSYSDKSLEIAKHNLIDIFKYNEQYRFMKVDSHSVMMNLKFDLIHIDGDHSYFGKVMDLELVKNNCDVLIIDDYLHIPDCRKAVDEFLLNNQKLIKKAYLIYSIRGTFVIEFNA